MGVQTFALARLFLIAILAIGPAIFIRRHILRARYRLNAFTPASEEGRKAYGILCFSLWALTILVLLAFVVLVPAAAAEFTGSALNFTMAVACTGIVAQGLATIIEGVVNGVVRPMSKGPTLAYRRDRHPKVFWMSMVGNTVFASMCLAILVVGAVRGVRAHEAPGAIAHEVVHA